MAVNLLPEQERAVLRREYYFRLAIVGSAFLFFCLVIGIMLLIPSYILSSGVQESLQERVELLSKSSSASLSAEVDRKRAEIASRLSTLSERAMGYAPTALIEGVVGTRPSGIKMDRLSIVKSGSGTFVTVSGVASSREALVSFRRTLEKVSLFATVELPLSDLARSQSIPFTLRMEVAPITPR